MTSLSPTASPTCAVCAEVSAPAPLPAQPFDLGALVDVVLGELLDIAAALLEHAHHVAALVPDGSTPGEPSRGGEQDAAQHHHERDAETAPEARRRAFGTVARGLSFHRGSSLRALDRRALP